MPCISPRLREQQQLQLQKQPPAVGGGPYTQRPASGTAASMPPPQPSNAAALNFKPGSALPPGYVQTVSANGVPQIECVETGTVNFPYGETPLPPIIILRNHDKQLIQLDGQHNDFANQMAHITSRISNLEGGGRQPSSSSLFSDHEAGHNNSGLLAVDDGTDQGLIQDITINSEFISELTENHVFISSVVENIMRNTNLSELVNEIEPIKSENRELRSLVLSQQEMLNGMNALMFKLMNHITYKNDCNNDKVEANTPSPVQPECETECDPQPETDCELQPEHVVLSVICDDPEPQPEPEHEPRPEPEHEPQPDLQLEIDA